MFTNKKYRNLILINLLVLILIVTSSCSKENKESTKSDKTATNEIKDSDLDEKISKINIVKSFKGDLKEAEEVSVVEEGGSDGKVLGNIPQLSKDNDYYLFLKESEGKYFITGAFQGRFIVREDHVFQQATEDVKLKEYKPLSSKDFEEILK